MFRHLLIPNDDSWNDVASRWTTCCNRWLLGVFILWLFVIQCFFLEIFWSFFVSFVSLGLLTWPYFQVLLRFFFWFNLWLSILFYYTSNKPHMLHGAGIFTIIYPINGPNVGKYTIHGAYGSRPQVLNRSRLNYVEIVVEIHRQVRCVGRVRFANCGQRRLAAQGMSIKSWDPHVGSIRSPPGNQS